MEELEINPLLQRTVIPGETFRLPSQGIFYKNGELTDDVKNGEVHVRAMTTMDEIIMKSPDMLFTGKAIVEVFSRCIPQVAKPLDLLSRDLDYLMLCLRYVTYGEMLTVTYKHYCDGLYDNVAEATEDDAPVRQIEPKEHTYDIPLRPIISQAVQIDPSTIQQIYEHRLPSGQVIKLKPITYGAVLGLNQNADLNRADIPSIDALKTSVESVLVDAIESVDGVTNKKHIAEWLRDVAPAGWIREAMKPLEEHGDWGANPTFATKCRECGAEIDIEFSTNPISFFS